MTILKKISDFSDKFSIYLMFLVTIFMTFCLIVLIFGRNFFNISFASLEEYSRFSLVWMTFIGSAIAYNRKEHMGVEYFLNKFFKGRVYKAFLLFNEALTLCLFLLLIYYGWEIVVFNLDIMSLQSRIPMAYVYIILPITGLIMLVHNLCYITKLVSNDSNKELTNSLKEKNNDVISENI